VTREPAAFIHSARQGKGRPALVQARLWRFLPLLILAACEVPAQLNPRLIVRDISGAANETRLPPPGMDRPSPNLASVPPIPQRPDPAARLALTQGLQSQRDLLNIPLPEGRPDAPLTEGEAEGRPSISAAPPRPAVLARAPVIPWTTQAPARAAQPAGAIEAAPERITPGEVPALPTADLLAPALPSPDLLAPAAPRR